MSKQKVKISSFLTERKDRFKPDIANKLGLKRVHKIDFSGNIHLVEHKPTRTNMILVKNGDLLISGINAEKGGVSVFEFEEDAIATIHYSSYTYDETKINIDYLKWFLKSNAFKQILIDQAGSGIKSELKPKRFLPLEIYLPSLDEQVEILKNLNSINSEAVELGSLISDSETLLSKLRQSILQDAVQGKLTKEWREQNPTVEPVSELLKKIKAEKEQLIKEKIIRKEKILPQVNNEEIPFEIPKTWEWTRWGNILANEKYSMKRGPFGSALRKGDFVKEGVRVFEQYNPINDDPHWVRYYITKEKHEKLKAFNTKAGDMLVSCSGATLGRITLLPKGVQEGIINQALLKIRVHTEVILNEYFVRLFRSSYIQDKIWKKAKGMAIPNMVGVNELKKIPIPLPPISEQLIILDKESEIINSLSELEIEVTSSKLNSKKLMQSVLSELLGEENNTLEKKTTSKKEIKKPSREIKYNSKTLLMDLVKLLEENGKLHAEDLWKMSKYPNDIDAFYAELKKQIEEEKAIKEVVNEKGYLELA
ncbi:restriction endonuclease subunit S [Polaribacter sp. Hel1_33_49]|uniref:restriction endonuclease subunit S n=1 Tax=Polaribacter sp. Hel1_33_49 TaxID=1336803 RepID=UPI00052DDB91|nr:restriction endonuclease subunit S [Polaribacter sp. Hel1_33_49]KGL61243.1 type I restriction-modification system, specificity subunit S [Polaribacter sp. Hel1_33_49]